MLFDLSDKSPLIIAGPCSAESPEQLIQTAAGVKAAGGRGFRAGVWKPRTRPGSFEGPGTPGLDWLRQAGRSAALPVGTEVASPQHVESCLKAGIDFLWIGARTSTNPFLVQEIAQALTGVDIPVFVKNPVNPDLALWLGAVERLDKAGVGQIGLIHRGFSSYESSQYRNAPIWQLAIDMRSHCPNRPLLCDPSHLGGNKDFVPEISQRALDLGFDGLMVETHNKPQEALSDSQQQLTPQELSSLVNKLVIRDRESKDAGFLRQLEESRARIDELDSELISVLAQRMELSREIGRIKKEKNVAIVQTNRWDEVLDRAFAQAQARNLDKEFVEKLFNTIHEASINEQNK